MAWNVKGQRIEKCNLKPFPKIFRKFWFLDLKVASMPHIFCASYSVRPIVCVLLCASYSVCPIVCVLLCASYSVRPHKCILSATECVDNCHWFGCGIQKLYRHKVIMQGKLFQRCAHLLYCSVLSLGGNVNTRLMSKPGMGYSFHIKKSIKYSGQRKLLCELSKLSKFNGIE